MSPAQVVNISLFSFFFIVFPRFTTVSRSSFYYRQIIIPASGKKNMYIININNSSNWLGPEGNNKKKKGAFGWKKNTKK